jgi:cyclopropane-fatty-acyl-phospholipid synthase
MLEHVGPANYSTYFDIVAASLDLDGLCLIQTIGDNHSVVKCDPWLDRYIFRGGVAPSPRQLAQAFEGRFIVEDWHNFGPDYYRTLMAWRANFVSNWDPATVQSAMDPLKFKRMWDYYLQSFAAAFKARHLQLWQIVLSRPGGVEEYHSLR